MAQDLPNIDESSRTLTPLARLRALRDYANRVFDDETRAATWLSRSHPAVRGGLCAVGAACQSDEGFREAVTELERLEREALAAHAAVVAAAPASQETASP